MSIKPISPQAYYNAYQSFLKADREDGKPDGKIDIKTLAGQKYAKYDNNHDGSVSLCEFLPAAIDLKKVNEQGSTIYSLIENIIKEAKKAKWSEEQIDRFLAIIFEGSGGRLKEILEEVNSYLSFGFSELSVLTKIRDFYFTLKNSEEKIPLINLLLNSNLHKTPEENLDRMLSFLAGFCGITAYLQNENLASDFKILYKILVNFLKFPTIKGSQNRFFFACLLQYNPKILLQYDQSLKAEEFTSWANCINSLNENTCFFLRSLALSGKIKSIPDLNRWVKIIESQKLNMERERSFFDFLLGEEIKAPEDLVKWLSFFRSLPNWKRDIISNLIRQETVSSYEEVVKIASSLKESVKVQSLQMPFKDALFYLLFPPQKITFEDLNASEKEAYLALQKMVREGKSTEEIINYIASQNKEVKKEESYSGNLETINSTIDWERVINLFPGLSKRIAESLAQPLMALPENASFEDIKGLFKKVPSRSILEKIIFFNKDTTVVDKFNSWLGKYWNQIRPLLGHIFLGSDKCEYHYKLRWQLRQQNISYDQPTSTSSFISSMEVIDLNTLVKEEVPINVIILGKNRVLITFLHNDDNYYSYVINPENPRSFREIIRKLFGKKDASRNYMIFYFPKIKFKNGTEYTISTNYQSYEGTPEILIGKSSAGPSQADTESALRLFLDAWQKEDEYLNQGVRFFEKNLSSVLKGKIKKEKYIEFENILTLIKAMDSGTAKTYVCETLGICSMGKYEEYENKIKQIIKEAQSNKAQMSREEFLLRAIEVCEGQVMLASLIAYNVLWGLRENMLEAYPDAFKLEKIKDPVGAIYHFYGTFFAAYAVQKCLVERYYTDNKFAQKIDQKIEEIEKKLKIDVKAQSVSGVEEMDLLLYLQFRLLQLGNSSAKEVLSLAGVFKEEVIEDADTSSEVFHDMEGLSFGHALYEVISGNRLTRRGTTLSLNDNYREAFVKILKKRVNPPSSLSKTDLFFIKSLLKIPIFQIFAYLL